MATYFSETALLKPPTERAAFSDRLAYVCAELSKLAYFKFEGGHTLDQVIALLRECFGDDRRVVLLEQQLSVVLSNGPSSETEATIALAAILAEAGFTLEQTFAIEATQGFLCTRKVTMESGTDKTLAFLIFRGTEPKDFRDIKSDVKAALEKHQLGNEVIELHCGYLAAFNLIRTNIELALAKLSYDQLFITGHSLGGALAIVATRMLASDITGACYTFGAPPVGTVTFQDTLKTPVYEIINEVDVVPRLPNPWLATGLLWILKAALLGVRSVTIIGRALDKGSWDEKLQVFIESMTKYRHPGYMSYLVGNGDSACLRFNVDSYEKFWWWFGMIWKMRVWQFRKMVSDHSIDEYIAKLRVHALRRQ